MRKKLLINSERIVNMMTSQNSLNMKTFLDTLPKEDELYDKCLELGLIMHRLPNVVSHIFTTLSPFVIQRDVLQELYRQQIIWNEAIDRAARDFSFLHSALCLVGLADKNFTGRLLRILEEVYLEDNSSRSGKSKKVYQTLMLGIFRSDYMRAMDSANDASLLDRVNQWKHVEINTISCSFAGLAPLVGDFHQYIRLHQQILSARKGGVVNVAVNNGDGEVAVGGTIERSVSGEEIPVALAEAVKAWIESVPLEEFAHHYNSTISTNNTPTTTATNNNINIINDNDHPQSGSPALGQPATHPEVRGIGQGLIPIVLVVAQEGERNVADVRKLLFRLLEAHHILSIRRTLRELHESMEVFDPPRNGPGEANASVPPFAVVEKRYVVAVAYFRSTYVPEDFPDDNAWQMRTVLERCNAIKCPSIPYHLMTFKKIQQRMCDREGVLVPTCFAGDVVKAETLAAHFMQQYSLNAEEPYVEDPETIVQEAIAHPEEFVLKPQLEGGGHLFFGEQMRSLLRDTNVEDEMYARIRKEFILMRKIHSPKETTALFSNQKIVPLDQDALSELGIYGVTLSDETGLRLNKSAGYVVRTKSSSTGDGGVVAGNACLNSLLVV